MYPSSLGGGKQNTTAGEHISQLVRRVASACGKTLFGSFFFLKKKNLNNGVITTKLFLSIKGQVDAISKPLNYFFDYVDGHAPADELMREIDYEVIIVKYREEWRRE